MLNKKILNMNIDYRNVRKEDYVEKFDENLASLDTLFYHTLLKIDDEKLKASFDNEREDWECYWAETCDSCHFDADIYLHEGYGEGYDDHVYYLKDDVEKQDPLFDSDDYDGQRWYKGGKQCECCYLKEKIQELNELYELQENQKQTEETNSNLQGGQ